MAQVDNHTASSRVQSGAPSSKWPAFPVEMLGTAGNKASLFPPMLIADAGKVQLGGQSPMFLVPDLVADAGLVRLGGQSPIFKAIW